MGLSAPLAAAGGTAGRDGYGQSQGGGGGGVRRPGNLFKSGGAGGPGASTAAGGGARSAQPFPPVEYTILLHPPLVIENLLPHAGTFELVDQVHVVEVQGTVRRHVVLPNTFKRDKKKLHATKTERESRGRRVALWVLVSCTEIVVVLDFFFLLPRIWHVTIFAEQGTALASDSGSRG